MFSGEKLKREREKRDWSQCYLAEKTPVSCQEVSKWETNEYSPDNILITRLSDIFNLTIDELSINDRNLKKIIQSIKENLNRESFIFLFLGF